MKPPDLRELDARLLPVAARRLRRAVDAVAVRRRRATRGAVRARQAAVAAARRWAELADRRYASTGLLGRVRDQPLPALLLVGAVVLAGTLSLGRLEPAPAPAAVPTPGPSLLQQASLGPAPGTDVDKHLAQGRALVEELAVRRPDGRYLALISLERYLPVGEVAALLEGLSPQRVYLRAPGIEGAETVEVPFAGTGARSVLPVLCTATASRKTADAENLRALASSLTAGTPEAEEQRARFASTATRNAAEAAAFTGDCVTAFAVVVEAEAAVLRDLLARPGIRGVEAAPAGTGVLDLTVTPLPPEVSGTVPDPAQR